MMVCLNRQWREKSRLVFVKKIFSAWSLQALIAGLLVLPLLALLIKAFSAHSPIFTHLKNTVLWDYVRNSITLVIGVCGFALLWGVPSAWIIARYRFWGHRFLRWGLLLPLSIPAYLSAFVYTNIFDYAGAVQSALRRGFGFKSAQDYWFFEIRSMGGAIFVLSLTFAPYVYWLLVQSFARLPVSQIQSAQLLGASAWRVAWQVIFPLSRPAIAIACALVAMETLADFGTVAYFSVWHLTTGIYDVWLAQQDLSAAAKLSVLTLLVVIALVLWERYHRRHVQVSHRISQRLTPKRLGKKETCLAWAWCGSILLLGFAIPAAWLLQAAWVYIDDTDWQAFAKMSAYSLQLALWVATLGSCMAFLLLAVVRARGRGQWLVRLASLGYAVPGTVLAIGVLMVTSFFDHQLNALTKALNIGIVGLIWSGTMLALIYAFWCRFAALGIGAIESGMANIPPSLDQSALLLGCSQQQLAWRVWLPLLRNSLLTAALLLFLESMKELSAAMLLRPFNVQTLSTYIYEYMSAERFEVAALPAVVMVIVSLPLVALLLRAMEK